MKPLEVIAASPAAMVSIKNSPSANKTLVCFHFAGGSAQSFYKWKNSFPDKMNLVAFEFPGRGRRLREPFMDSIRSLAEHLAECCQNLPNTPWVFFGHSLGALIAYETVRCLQEAGEKVPEQLIISARNNPAWLPVSSGLPQLGEHALKEYLGSLEGTPTEVLNNQPLMDMTLPILKADLEIIYNYQHLQSEPLEIPIVAFGAIDDEHVTFEALIGWKNITNSKFTLNMVSGGHFSLMEKPAPLFECLERIIEETD